MISIQLLDCQPDNLLVDLRVGSLPQRLRDLRQGFPAITLLPNKGCGFIQTMGAIAIEIINEHFIRQMVNY